MPLAEGKGGEIRTPSSTSKEIRFGPYSDLIVNDSGYGRYFEATRNGKLFHAIGTAVAPNNATYAVGAANAFAATSTPVLALINPAGSPRALSILQASMSINGGSATNSATPIWAAAVNSAAITTAAANATITSARLDASFGTVTKAYSNVAMTGMTNGVSLRPWNSSMAVVINVALNAHIIGEEVAGSILVPPNSLVAILFSATPAALGTVQAGITWAEVDWPLA